MAIITQEISEIDSSLVKEIDEGAMGLILDNLQKYQYQYPYPSTIRELFSNGIDAVAERNVGLSILEGLVEEEEMFLAATSVNLHKDSKFDPTYYDPKWLSPDNQVYIRYINKPHGQRDMLVVEDFGVGLSHDHGRLGGYFKMGYSTKRLNKFTLGRFGIGAKAALSTGMPCYTVRNYYNGWESAFNVYVANVEGILPEKMIIDGNIVKGKLNILQSNGRTYTYYSYPTNRFNGLRVELEVKKHNYSKVLDAVKSQLMYFPQLVFEVDNGSVLSRIDTAAAVLTQTEQFIVSEQNYYQQPHIVIAGMNYGLINWEELELEKKQGALGIIVNQEDVDITPSREAVVWTDKTKERITRAMEEVVHVATEAVQGEVNTDDLATWVNNLTAITSFRNNAGMTKNMKILSVLRYMVDGEKINPKFDVKGKLFLLQEIKSAMYIRVLTKDGDKVKRERVWDIDMASSYWIDGNASVAKDTTIMDKHNKAYIITSVLDENGVFRNEEIREVATKARKTYQTREEFMELCDYVDEYFRQKLPTYEDIEVVKEVAEKAKKQEKDETEAKQAEINRKLTRAELLAAGGHINVKPIGGGNIKVSTKWLSELRTPEVYYGNKADSEILDLAYRMVQPGITARAADIPDGTQGAVQIGADALDEYYIGNSYWGQWSIGSMIVHKGSNVYPNETPYITLVEISQTNARYLKGFHHINNFFQRVEGKTLTMAKALINWNTARLINKEMGSYSGLLAAEVKELLPAFYNELEQVHQYLGRYYSKPQANGEWLSELETMLDRMTTLQMFIDTNPTDDASIAEMVRELGADPASINATLAIDLDVYKKARAVREFIDTISLLRWVNWDASAMVTTDVQEYLSTKGIRDLMDI